MAEENIVSMAAASWKSDVSEVSLDLGLELEQEFIVVDELEEVESAEIQDGDHRDDRIMELVRIWLMPPLLGL